MCIRGLGADQLGSQAQGQLALLSSEGSTGDGGAHAAVGRRLHRDRSTGYAPVAAASFPRDEMSGVGWAERERLAANMEATAFCNPLSRGLSGHFCCVLFIRRKSLGHTEQGCEYQEAGVIGSHLGGCLSFLIYKLEVVMAAALLHCWEGARESSGLAIVMLVRWGN